MTNQYRSDFCASVYETALGMMETGTMSKRIMKSFNEMCLMPVAAVSCEDICALRLLENASQWERGEKRPRE